MVSMGSVTKLIARSTDDIARAIYTRIDDFIESAARKTALEIPKIPSQAVSLGKKVSSFTTQKAIPFVSAHPLLTTGVSSAVAGGLIVTALQKRGSVTSSLSSLAFDSIYEDKITGETNQGEVTDTDKIEKEKDYGLLGNALGITGTTLFGEAGSDVAKFVEGAKPWIVGAGIVAAVVAVGYTVNSLRGNRQTIRFEDGMSRTRQ